MVNDPLDINQIIVRRLFHHYLLDQLNRTWSAHLASPTPFYLQEPAKMFEVHDAGEKFVVFWDGPRSFRKEVAKWFEDRNYPVGKPKSEIVNGRVVCASYLATACDKDDALLAKLTWGGE